MWRRVVDNFNMAGREARREGLGKIVEGDCVSEGSFLRRENDSGDSTLPIRTFDTQRQCI